MKHVGDPLGAPRRLSLRRNFAWTLLGNVVYSACQWGTVVAIAKLSSAEGVGVFSLGLAISAPLFMLSNLQLRSVQATDVRDHFSFGDYFTLRLLLSAAALLVLTSILLVARYNFYVVSVALLLGVAKSFEALSDITYGLFQQQERMDVIARSLILRGVISLLLFGVALGLTRNLAIATSALALAWLTILVLNDIRISRRYAGSPAHTAIGGNASSLAPRAHLLRWNSVSLRQLLSISYPLGLVMSLISLNANIPRYFLERATGPRQLGIYSALSYFSLAGAMIVNAVGQSATPRLARYYADGRRGAFSSLIVLLAVCAAALGLLAAAVAWLAGPSLLIAFYSREFADSQLAFVVLMAATALGYPASVFGYGITAARYFRVQAPLFALVTLLTLAASAFLIPRHGILGAALSSVVSAVSALGGSFVVLLHAMRKPAVQRSSHWGPSE